MNIDEEFMDDEFNNFDDFEDDGEPRYTVVLPTTDHERIELLRRALNFPERPGTTHAYDCCTPTDLDELESILKNHLRK